MLGRNALIKTGLMGRALAGAIAVVAVAVPHIGGAADYRTVTVPVEQIGEMTTLAGTVVPYKEVNLAAQAPGQVTFIAGSEGDSFDKEALLVTIDDDTIQAQRRAALADINSARAAVENARVQYSRELVSPRVNSITN
ncbi:MAG: hypothetical protein HQL35_12405, partial [Alphaproteobacteria bacterium]|nr:hypothetical protein [Alphaproteobacteria bacterium]